MTISIDLSGIEKPRYELTPGNTAILVFYGIISKDNPSFAGEFEKALQELEFVPTPSTDTEAVHAELAGIVYEGMRLALESVKKSYEASKEEPQVG